MATLLWTSDFKISFPQGSILAISLTLLTLSTKIAGSLMLSVVSFPFLCRSGDHFIYLLFGTSKGFLKCL